MNKQKNQVFNTQNNLKLLNRSTNKKKELAKRRKAEQADSKQNLINREINKKRIERAKAAQDPEEIKKKNANFEIEKAERQKIEIEAETKLQEIETKLEAKRQENRDLAQELSKTQGKVKALRQTREVLMEESDDLREEIDRKEGQIEMMKNEKRAQEEDKGAREAQRELVKKMQGKQQMEEDNVRMKLKTKNFQLGECRNRFDMLVKDLDREMPAGIFDVEDVIIDPPGETFFLMIFYLTSGSFDSKVLWYKALKVSDICSLITCKVIH